MCSVYFLEIPTLISLSSECPGGPCATYNVSGSTSRGSHQSLGATLDTSCLKLWPPATLWMSQVWGPAPSSYHSCVLVCSVLSPELCLALSVQIRCHFLLDKLRELSSQNDVSPRRVVLRPFSLSHSSSPARVLSSSCGECIALTVCLAASRKLADI